MARKVTRTKILWDVFISHNRKQKDWVRAIVRQWRDLGLKVFFDEDCIEPGEDVMKGIERGLKGSRHTVLIISPDSVQSRWVAMETSISVYADPNASDRRLIPLLLERTDTKKIDLAIQRLSWVDLTDSNVFVRLNHYHSLLSYLGVEAKPPLPEPPGPNRDLPRKDGESVSLEIILDRKFNLQEDREMQALLSTIREMIKISSEFNLIAEQAGALRMRIEVTRPIE